MPVLELAPGALFARDYKVERALASGGMGAVYVVEQLSTGVRRALKIMRGELVADDKSRQRFDQEARLGALIASEHIVKVIQAGVDEASATPWLCMELLVGEDLATALARRDRMTHAETAALFEQACHALELAHRIPIVHRDLKPENLFLSQPLGPGVPFSVKILDLGIAKLIQESQGATAPTASLGTPLWMAPEQTDPNGEVSPATDVWALGLIAFRVLTGRHFWRAANAAHPTLTMVLAEVLSAEIPSATERAAELGGLGRLVGQLVSVAVADPREPRHRVVGARGGDRGGEGERERGDGAELHGGRFSNRRAPPISATLRRRAPIRPALREVALDQRAGAARRFTRAA